MHHSVFLVVPSPFTAARAIVGHEPAKIHCLHNSLGRDTSIVAERSIQTRILGPRRVLRPLDTSPGVHRRKCLCFGRDYEQLQDIVIQAIGCTNYYSIVCATIVQG